MPRGDAVSNEPSVSSLAGRPLAAGALVGHYQIVGFLGAGGMGEVYRARDTRLDRDVALKMVPAALGADSDRLRRFAQEARTMSRLNHPNIVAIFDVGEHEGRPFIVSELLEGETLRALLEREPQLAVRRAVEFAIQIARALAAAHEKAIVHRDLKPANVFVARDGHLKLLDFGLAKLVHPEWDDQSDPNRTISAVSLPGTVLGSTGYMSPEQVEARPLDGRSDIFSLGVVMYEMLAGRRAFNGVSTPSVLSAILRDEPAGLASVRHDVSPALSAIVRRCLEKQPGDRFQSARDLAFSLEEVVRIEPLATPLVRWGAVVAARVARRSIGSRLAKSLTAFIATAVVLIVLAVLNSRSAAVPSRRTAGSARNHPELVRLMAMEQPGSPAISPDGRYVVHTSGAEPGLWLEHIATASTTRIVAGEGIAAARFSPDGNYIYFARYDPTTKNDVVNLFRIPMLGADPQMIARNVSEWFTVARDNGRLAFFRTDDQGHEQSLIVADANGTGEWTVASGLKGFISCPWSPDATRFVCSAIADPDPRSSMIELNAATGGRRPLPQMMGLFAPEWLPDGSALVGSAPSGAAIGEFQLWRVEYPSGRATLITNDLSDYRLGSITADGTTLSAIRTDRTTNLWSVALDDPASIRQVTRGGINTQDGNFGIRTTPDGRILWASGVSGKSIDLWSADADGSNRKRITFDDQAGEKRPDVSPDGQTVTYVRDTTGSGGGEIWRMNIDGSLPVRLTDGRDDRNPHFTADGQRILFGRTRDGEQYLFEISVSGGEPRQLDARPAHGPVPSPDGKWLLVDVEQPQPHFELRPADGSAVTRTFPFSGTTKRWRPDSRAFAFIRGGPGGMQVWQQDLDSTAAPRQLTRLPRGSGVAWGFDYSRDGQQIVFARGSTTRDLVLIKNLR
jgi:eukaryotic-like serine/threonine-protein kinase